jgi:hypothetical protein
VSDPVIPAKAGTSGRPAETSRPEVPAFAGMTVLVENRLNSPYLAAIHSAPFETTVGAREAELGKQGDGRPKGCVPIREWLR